MQPYEIEHAAWVRYLGPECTVLMKSDGSFPLEQPCKLALFGSGARHTIKGGTGSGEVNTRYAITVERGLTEAGFELTTTAWLDSYDEVRRNAKRAFIRQIKAEAHAAHQLAVTYGMGAVMPEPEYDLPLMGDGAAAIYVLSRISGEGSDRKPVAGDILLTETEQRDILELARRFSRFMLVLNVGGVVDLTPVLGVGNILLLGQLGAETGAILADLLLGKAYPSGKLTTSWSAWSDYPTIGEFGGRDDTRYTEGIYVGYRYFDSIGKRALFPFGFGLGYTTFQVEPLTAALEGTAARVIARVRNAGKRVGREVVQLYVSCPARRLDQPFQTLAAFCKTRELQPGEEQVIDLRFDMREIASFDMRGAVSSDLHDAASSDLRGADSPNMRGAASSDADTAAWILEQGDYILRLGTSSVDTAPIAIIRLDRDAVVKTVEHAGGSPDFEDWKPDAPRTEALPDDLPVMMLSANQLEGEIVGQKTRAENEAHEARATSTAYEDPEPSESPAEADPIVAGMSTEELARLCVGAAASSGGIASIIGSASKIAAGAAGETATLLLVSPLVMADGPAGLRLSRQYTIDKKGVHAIGSSLPETVVELLPAPLRFLLGERPRKSHSAARDQFRSKPRNQIHEQNCTAIPIGTAIAQSWNLEAAERFGDIVGGEMERFGVHLWLAPALNIHRSIRCGRNFEYFSEDPLISGLFAGAFARGVGKHPRRSATLKHFAANNQETNRYNSNSLVSERALREIYLRGFGIAVREGRPLAVMTSYNLLNGTHTSERRDLVEGILRREFGFDGIVMTDWIVMGGTMDKHSRHPGPHADLIAAAGNDLTMPGSKADLKRIAKGLKDGTVTRRDLECNATHILRIARRLTAER